MKNNKSLIISLLAISALFSIFFVSCSKDENTHLLTTASIIIDSPLSSSIYSPNDTVKISGTITSDSTLHGYQIYLRNKADKSSIAIFNVHEHATQITIDQFWVNTIITDTTDVELEIIAALDHDGNSIGKKVSFKCIP
ncbi:MAG: hypothetical protein IPP77_05660 [Bacteroidetes bacterium]|nr:hypothetical protein [Bacteroidota bacterium]